MRPAIYRQGDVLLIKRDHPVPRTAAPRHSRGDRVVLALGEATGHAHAINSSLADLFKDRDGTLYLRVEGPCDLTHEEHDPIELDEGVYEVRRQREYIPEDRTYMPRPGDADRRAWRPVSD
jgi:hypothetical protein